MALLRCVQRNKIAAPQARTSSTLKDLIHVYRSSHHVHIRPSPEITDAALGWMEKQAKASKPFFLWYNSTALHFRTRLADKNRGKSGQDDYSDR